MCEWTHVKKVYTHKTKSAVYIMERSYGCGAWDSYPAREAYFEVEYFSSYFIRTRPVDLNQLQLENWSTQTDM